MNDEAPPRVLDIDVVLKAKHLVSDDSLGTYVNGLLKRGKSVLILPEGDYLSWSPEVKAVEYVEMGREGKI